MACHWLVLKSNTQGDSSNSHKSLATTSMVRSYVVVVVVVVEEVVVVVVIIVEVVVTIIDKQLVSLRSSVEVTT